MKYKTLKITYPTQELEEDMITSMSENGWGLVYRIPPDYPSGNKNGYYTFVAADHVQDAEYSYYSNPRLKVKNIYSS